MAAVCLMLEVDTWRDYCYYFTTYYLLLLLLP